MQITFDTSIPQDLEILRQILKFSLIPSGEIAQPAVANTGNAASDPQIVLHAEGGVVNPAAFSSEAAEVPEKPKRTRRAKEEQVEMPLEEPAPVVEAVEQPVEQEAPAKEYTVDEVRAALQAFTAKAGIEGGLQLLRNFGAQRISELKAENFAAFVAGCEA